MTTQGAPPTVAVREPGQGPESPAAVLRRLEAGGRGWACLREVEALARNLDQLGRDERTRLAALTTQVANRTSGLAARIMASVVEACPEQPGPAGRRAALRELALATGSSPKEAERATQVGTALATSSGLAAAVEKGTLSPAKTTALVDGCKGLGTKDATAVLNAAASTAQHGSAWQARQQARHLAGLTDPAVTETRRQLAWEQRTVYVEAGEDGMSWLKAALKAVDADRIMARLRRQAVRTSADDARTLGQRLADHLRNQLLGVDATAHCGGPDNAQASGRGELLVVAPERTLHPAGSTEQAEAGTDTQSVEQPGWVLGATGGQVSPADTRRLAARHGHRTVVRDPASGRLVALGARKTRHATGQCLGTSGDGTAGGPNMDPATWMSESLASDAYIPSELLRTVVAARDQHCRFPGCSVPATECDIDHVRPFNRWRAAGQQTVAGNLHALCRAHHLAKHEEKWRVRRDPATGRTVWVSRSGARHVVEPATLPVGSDHLIVVTGPATASRPKTPPPARTRHARGETAEDEPD